jgi:hypothetical protein
LTKSTKYDRNPTYFWLPVVIAEWELGSRERGEGRKKLTLITDLGYASSLGETP